jgi:outer membrane immunogenic protein
MVLRGFGRGWYGADTLSSRGATNRDFCRPRVGPITAEAVGNTHGAPSMKHQRTKHQCMKRLVIAGALALAFAGQALAADFPAPPGPPPYLPVAPLYNWTGFYVGVNGGGAVGNSNWTDPNDPATGNFTVDGGLFGGTIGANYQTGRWVFGLEGDWDWSNLSATTFNTSCAFVGCTTQSDWLATVRGRVGYTWDRLLVYGTAGGAFADVQAAAGSLPLSDSVQAGWTAGAGVEYAFLPNWTAKVEYLYVGLGSMSCAAASCGATGGVNTNVSLNENVIRGGVNFKFGGGWW